MTPRAARLLSARILNNDVEAVERVSATLAACLGNRGKAAKKLGISRRTLHNWVQGSSKLRQAFERIPPERGPGSGNSAKPIA
jgi:DNA-binding NtrC family response regulator